MGLGRVLAPGFQPCTLSVGGTAPRAALAYFWPWPWRGATGSGSPPAARTRRVSRSENRECIKSASERARVHRFCALHARARLSRARRRHFFLRIRLVAQQDVRRRRRAQRATGSASPAAACTSRVMGLGRVLAPEISAVHFIRWRYGAARRAGLLFGLGLRRSYGVRIAAGHSHQEGLALRKSRVH